MANVTRHFEEFMFPKTSFNPGVIGIISGGDPGTMAIRGVALTVTYTAWNTLTNQPASGDVSHHTIRYIRDGIEAVPANAPAEVDATGAKGEYRITITATEMLVDFITICGVSSTTGVVILPVKISTEHGVLPTIQQGNIGAVITSGVGTGQINPAAGAVPVAGPVTVTGVVPANVTLWQGLSPNALIAGRVDANASNPVTISGPVTIAGSSPLNENYPPVNGNVTLEQAIYEILQGLTDFFVIGNSLNVRKRDRKSIAEVYLLDDAENPTSRTRTA